MKICHVFPTLLLHDGPSNFVSTLVGQLQKMGVDNTVVSLRHPPLGRSAETSLTARGARYFELGMKEGIWDPLAVYRLAKFLSNERPDIVQCNLFRANVYGPIAAKIAGVHNVICIAHNEEEYMTGSGIQARLARILERLVSRCATTYVAVSQAVADTVISKVSISKISVIHAGLDPLKRDATREAARTLLGISPESFVLGSVGRLHRQKAYSDLLRVAKKTLPTIPNLRVVIIGEGPERQRLNQLSKELGITEQVSLPGLIRMEISELLPAFDVFIMTSLHEGMPATLAEAMRSGVPSIVTDAGGIREMIRNGETGIMTAPGDCDSLSEAVVSLAQNSQLRTTMGAAARDFFNQKFCSSLMANRYFQLYSDISGVQNDTMTSGR